MKRPWYKRYGGDFVLGTMSLSLEEKGAYSLCLDLIYDRGGPIPDDARWLSGVCGVSLRKWAALRARLIEAGKLVSENGCLTNPRAGRELAERAAESQEHSENGAKGGRKRAENVAKKAGTSDVIATELKENSALDQAGLKPIQKPEAREEEPPKPPEGVQSVRSTRVSAADVDAIWEITPAESRRRSSKADLRRALDAATRRGRDLAAIRGGLLGYFASHDATRNNFEFVKGVHRMVEQDRWESFAAADVLAPTSPEDPWTRRMLGWRASAYWNSEWGPKPGKPGCKAPAEHLEPQEQAA